MRDETYDPQEYPGVIEAATVEYKTFPAEFGRRSGRGGSTNQLHSHVMYIGGTPFSFLAISTKKWVFKGDTVSFRFKLVEKGGKTYRNVAPASIEVLDKNGEKVYRGDRSWKTTLRSTPEKLPGSAREKRS